MSTPSWGRGDPRNGIPPWMWPVVIDSRQREAATTPATPIRIGDTERDEAVSDLGDHFAAGRLSRDELDERIDKAVQAKFSTDLEPLFADLPEAVREPVRPGPRASRPSPLFLIFPLLVIGLVITAIAIGAPWMLWGLIWVAVVGKFWGRRWVGLQQQGGQQQGGPQQSGPQQGGPPAHRPGPPARYR